MGLQLRVVQDGPGTVEVMLLQVRTLQGEEQSQHDQLLGANSENKHQINLFLWNNVKLKSIYKDQQ